MNDVIMVRTDDHAHVCVEAIGNRTDPALLLIGAATWSMDWWEDELCRRLADQGRLVVRYDQRDTGRSTTCPPGSPDYSATDLVTDAVAVLDALDLDRAHVVGLSMGGGIAQRLALEHRERVATATLISTSPIDPGSAELPPPTPEILATFSEVSQEPDWTDRDRVIDHVVDGERPYAGPGTFDGPRMRALAGRVFDRTADMASSMTNHFLLEDDHTTRMQAAPRASHPPTLVLHGTADPLFPLAHGQALADTIPGARLVELDGVGHQLPPPATWDLVVGALLAHTSRG